MRLKEPIKLGGYTASNRIVVPPMADFGQNDDSYEVNERALRRYGNLASGGAGILTIEACTVSRTNYTRTPIEVATDACLPGMKRLAEATTGKGPLVLVQLIHNGLEQMDADSLSDLSPETLRSIQEDFRDAALRCKKAGFQGVELHGAHGYFLNQILDEENAAEGYSVSPSERARYTAEIVEMIREAAGPEFIISVRIGARDIPSLIECAVRVADSGADILSVSTGYGDYRDETPADFGFDSKIYAASRVKKAVSIPVTCVGGIMEGTEAEAILEKGYADFVAVGRGQLADPDWAGKVLKGERPIPCRRCDKCLWFRDGKLCPALPFGFF